MLTVTRSVRDAMLDHAGADLREVCGILGGEHGEERSRAVAVRRAENAADTPRRSYRIDPAQQLELMEDLAGAGHDVVGFYHSHPEGPPRPSRTDVARATWVGYSYLIPSLAGAYPTVGSWRWTGERFARETIRVR